MTFSGLRADAPASVVRALISPHQEAKDAYDFAEQDEQYFKSIKQKISSAVTASLLRK
jgi:hypothetical protein